MNYKKKLLITLPSYNRCELLKIQLEKLIILKENSTIDIDIFVFNNGSTDNTEDILADYPNDKITIFKNDKNKNWGPLIAQISSFIKKESPHYDYFWILSDDDFIFEKELVNFFNQINEDSTTESAYFLKSIKIAHNGKKLVRPVVNQELYETINDSLLISTIIYPTKNIFKYFDIYFEKFKENDFAHASFILSYLKTSKNIKISENILFTENNNFIWNNSLYKCFYKDRSAILKELDKILSKNQSRIHIIRTTNFFIQRSIIWFYFYNIKDKDSDIKKMIWSSLKDCNFNFKSIVIYFIYFIHSLIKKTALAKKIFLMIYKFEKEAKILNDLFVEKNKTLSEYI